MSSPNLDALRETLNAIPADEVTAPTVPPSALAEAMKVLVGHIRTKPTLEQMLVKARFDAAAVNAVEQAADALLEAELAWTVATESLNSTDLAIQLRDARRLRRRLIDACQLYINDRRFSRLLNISVIGDSAVDVGLHLNVLAAVIEDNLPAFAGNELFNAAEEALRARTVASQLSRARIENKVNASSRVAKEARDRAYTWASEQWSLIRASGRFASGRDANVRPYFNDLPRGRRPVNANGAAAGTDSFSDDDDDL